MAFSDWFDFSDDALDLDWGSDIVSSGKDIFSNNPIDIISSNFNVNDLFSDLGGFDLSNVFGPSDALDLDWTGGNISDTIGGWFSDAGDSLSSMFDFGGYSKDVIGDLDAINFADMEDMDAGTYLDDQYAADILSGLDQADMDAETFRQQAVEQSMSDALNFADQADMDAARYLDEVQGMDTSGFEFADQEDIDRALYQDEAIDEANAAINFADQEDIDREMYREEQDLLDVIRAGETGGDFVDLSGKGGTGGDTGKDDTKITTKDVTDGKDGKDGTDTITKIIKDLTGNKDNLALIAALLGGLFGLMGRGGQPQTGYQGGIPKYIATRGTPTAPTAGGRRPGGAGIGSLTGGVTYTRAAQGGLMELAKGSQGDYLRGATDGMADKIPASIEGKQPALLSHGEYVIPADVVSHLGNGNSDAGAKRLEEMSKNVRKARTGNPKQGKQINPRKYMPA